MDIGEPRKIIEVEPVTIPVPETIPLPDPEPAPADPVPVDPGIAPLGEPVRRS
jgi:hypothetical protein